MGTAPASGAVFRAPAENGEAPEKWVVENSRPSPKHRDARRVPERPGRACSPKFGIVKTSGNVEPARFGSQYKSTFLVVESGVVATLCHRSTNWGGARFVLRRQNAAATTLSHARGASKSPAPASSQ